MFNNKKQWRGICFLILGIFSIGAFADEPPVKKSKSGICHARGSTYYAKTKHYTSFQTMDACLKSGGRRPRR
ncbi:hypothetical protein ABUE20_00370 [Celerinatantimonas sp. YJH-8]